MDIKSCIPDCCGSSSTCCDETKYYNISKEGEILTVAGSIPVVATTLSQVDIKDTWKVRWRINRMSYKIKPSLYAVGKPDSSSPVLVTANYKLSFDSLRKELSSINAWILVLDTNGINVWCAAGKGTFGTEELIRQINNTHLHSIVSHNKLILPQLGAPGVSAHIVTKTTGFKVIYGPVKASDIPEFIASKYNATPSMRQVNFTFKDRLVLIPVELMSSLKPILAVTTVIILVTSLASYFSVLEAPWIHGAGFVLAFIGAILSGVAVTPLLLPYIPFRAFAIKGWIIGLAWIFMFTTLWSVWGSDLSFRESLGLYLLLPSLTAFLSLNFTGCSTYTSQSGVEKEMRLGLPIMIISSFLGLGALAIEYFTLLF